MARRFISYFFNLTDYPEIRKQILIDPTTGLHVNLQHALASYIKEAWRSGQPVVTLYMIKIRNYQKITEGFGPEDYAALRIALSEVAELVYLHDRVSGTLGLIFLRAVAVPAVRKDITSRLHAVVDGKPRRWPTESGRLEFSDAHFHFDPEERTYLKASALIDLVTQGLATAKSAPDSEDSDEPALLRRAANPFPMLAVKARGRAVFRYYISPPRAWRAPSSNGLPPYEGRPLPRSFDRPGPRRRRLTKDSSRRSKMDSLTSVSRTSKAGGSRLSGTRTHSPRKES